MFILWYRRRSEGERSVLVDGGAAPGQSTDTATEASGTPLDKLLAFAGANGLTVTSPKFGPGGEIIQGRHNPGSLHYLNRAIDVRSRGMSDFQMGKIEDMAARAGIRFRDERLHPAGQGVWSAPHFHLEIP